MAKLDLNNLKAEIDNRKKGRNSISAKLGEPVTESNVPPKEEFLHGLLNSFNSGRPNNSTKVSNEIVNRTAIRTGEPTINVVTEQPSQKRVPLQPFAQQATNEEVGMSPERDEQLWAEIERKRKMTLGDSLANYSKLVQSQQQQHQPMNLNEGYLVENVKKIVDNYLIENFGQIIEEAVKNVMIETYAAERIKEVLHGNKEMMKTVVYDTIKEIQNKKKLQTVVK